MNTELLLLCFVPLLLAGILVAIPLFWCFVVWLISIMSGWQELAQKYRTQQPASGKQFISQYGFVNGGRYGNILNLTTNETGVFLEVMPLFRFNHPRLFIPWHDLHHPNEIVFRHRPLIRVDVGHPAMASLSLPPIVFEQSEGRRVLID